MLQLSFLSIVFRTSAELELALFQRKSEMVQKTTAVYNRSPNSLKFPTQISIVSIRHDIIIPPLHTYTSPKRVRFSNNNGFSLLHINNLIGAAPSLTVSRWSVDGFLLLDHFVLFARYINNHFIVLFNPVPVTMIIRKKRTKAIKETQRESSPTVPREERKPQVVQASPPPVPKPREINQSLRCLQLIASGVRKTPTTTRIELRGSSRVGKYDALNLLRAILRDSPSVSALDLSWVGLGDENARTLFRSLQNSRYVKELVLCGNEVGKTSSDYLGEFLRKNKSVVKLHMGSNALCQDAAESLARGLRENTTIEELDLWNCSLGDDAGAKLIESAQYAKSLKVLRLNMNKLGQRSLEAAARMLQVPTALQVLNLDSNPLLFGRKDETEKEFVSALANNQNLLSLGIPYTGVTDFSAKLIFDCLTINTTLEYLDVGYNEICKDGYDVMVECIPKMKTLKHLRTHARAQLVTADDLSNAIEQNTSLHQFTSICVGCNKVWACLRRNQVVSRANKFLSSEDTPLAALPKAIHRLAAEKDGGTTATFKLLERYFR